MTDSLLNVAVVGGGIGKHHIQAYKALPERFKVYAICDIDKDKAQAIAAEFNIPNVYTDLAELCKVEEVDIIDICTPPHLHRPQLEQVLAAKKHAVCEKPLVGSLREVDELIALEAESGKRVMPIFQYRFGHGLQKLKFLMSEGLAGTAYLATVETSWRRREAYYAVPWRGKWQTELGGVLLGHAIHAHDMLSYVLGPIRSVYARAATRVNPIEVEDCAVASLEMADGSLASLATTLGSPEEITRHRFSFKNLSAESGTAPYSNSADPWKFVGDSPELAEAIEEALSRFVLLPERFEGQFHRLYDALTQGTELPVTLQDARASLELVTALYYSAETSQAVNLPTGSDHPRYESWLPDQARSLSR